MGYGTLTDPFTDPSRAVGYGDAKFMRDGPFKGARVRMCEDRCIPASTNKHADDQAGRGPKMARGLNEKHCREKTVALEVS